MRTLAGATLKAGHAADDEQAAGGFDLGPGLTPPRLVKVLELRRHEAGGTPSGLNPTTLSEGGYRDDHDAD